MQKENKIKINLVFLFVFCSIHLFSQNPFSINVQFHQGVTGIDGKDKFDQGIVNRKISFIKGSDLSLGIGVKYFYGERRKFFSLSGSILWNYYSFQRREQSTISFVGALPFEDQIIQTFQCHSLLIPLKISRHFRGLRKLEHVGFSFGLVPRKRLISKITIESLTSNSSITPTEPMYEKLQFYEGEAYPFLRSSPQSVEFKFQIDLQYLVGLNYYPDDKLTFSLEYRNLVLENYLIWGGTELANPNSGTLSLGMSWKLF